MTSRAHIAVFFATVLAAIAPVAFGRSGGRTAWDPSGDAVIARTDVGADGPIHPDSKPPDVKMFRARRWAGAPSDVVEFTLEFDGLVCPPGPLGLGSLPFNPLEFGTTPLYGFFEIDIDEDRNTGGELGDAAKFRYLANLGRLGEVPEDSASERAATDGFQLDSNFNSTPQFERSGADFAVVFCGCFDVTVVDTCGDLDGCFNEGDSWTVSGRFFQRSGGYELASAAYGGSFFGMYDPITFIHFEHSIASDQTTLTLLFPLDMKGAAKLSGEPQEPIDLDVSNHCSIEEALDDIIAGAAAGLSGPTAVLADRWVDEFANQFLNPEDWRLRGLCGTSYESEQYDSALFVWTDAIGDHTFADFNGDGHVNGDDLDAFDAIVATRDGGPRDADQTVNGEVRVPSFAAGFSVFDLDGDGLINSLDRVKLLPPPMIGDANGDCVVNFADLTMILTNWGTVVPGGSPPAGDANADGVVNFSDITAVLTAWGAVCPS